MKNFITKVNFVWRFLASISPALYFCDVRFKMKSIFLAFRVLYHIYTTKTRFKVKLNCDKDKIVLFAPFLKKRMPVRRLDRSLSNEPKLAKKRRDESNTMVGDICETYVLELRQSQYVESSEAIILAVMNAIAIA